MKDPMIADLGLTQVGIPVRLLALIISQFVFWLFGSIDPQMLHVLALLKRHLSSSSLYRILQDEYAKSSMSHHKNP
jgi:hypothetical protein